MSDKVYTVKVRNKVDGRIDVHKELRMDEVDYIKSSPNLEVEIVEINVKRVVSR